MSSSATPLSDEAAFAAASTPSRAGAGGGGKAAKGKKGNSNVKEKPDYLSPPPANAQERRDWERMATRMEGFHSYFRTTFQQIWELADKFDKQGIPLKDYLKFAEELERHLQAHHGIEERYIFPILATRMPEFQEEHPEEHEKIHEGLNRYLAYINAAKSSPNTYSAESFRKVLSSFGPMLMYHLDAEVETLRGDNLRRYYTLEEVRRLPM